MALLDSYGSGIYAAVAVVKLNDAYTGDCMRVRRSSDDTTIEVGFDANGDLDTDAILSFVGVGDGFVEIWYHQGSLGAGFQNLTFAEQPKIVDSGALITLKGRPAVEFTGSQHLTALGHGSISDLSVFCVTQANTTSGGPQRVLQCNKDTTNRWIIQQRSTADEWFDIIGGDGVITTSPGFTDHVITSFIWDGSEIDVWKNSSYIGAGALSAPTSFNSGTEPIYMGSGNGTNFYNGKVQSVLIYTTDKTLQRSSIDGELDVLLTHKLESSEISSTSTLDSTDIGQTHVLDFSEVDSGIPIVENPSLSEITVLSASELISIVSLDSTTIGQTHVLQSDDVSSSVLVDNAVLKEEYILSTTEIDSSAPVVDATNINQVQSLSSEDVVSIIIINDSNLEQEHILVSNEVSTEVEVDTPNLYEENTLVSEDSLVGTPTIEASSINQIHALSSNSITTSIDLQDTSINQDQNLTSVDIFSTGDVEDTGISQTHALGNTDLSSAVFLENSDMLVLVHIVPEDISSTILFNSPDINQSQRLIISRLDFVPPELDTPELSQTEFLSGEDLFSGQVLFDTPAVLDLSTLDVLDSSDLLGGLPLFDFPTLSGIDELYAEDIGYCPYDISTQLDVINRGVQRASKLIPHFEDLDLDVCESFSNIVTQLDIINEGLKKASKLIPHE